MINSVIDAVSRALNGEFGDDYEIYCEEMEQGLKEPCFFITIIEASVQPYPGKRYIRRNQLCLQYFTSSTAKNVECEETAIRLEECLEYINLDGGQIRGTDMSHKVHEGVLNFFVNYNMFVKRIENDEQMKSLVSDTLIKEAD